MNEDLIELRAICKQYFNITFEVARRRASLGVLPIPAFRLTDSGRGTLFVRKTDLDKLVEDRAAKASKLNSQIADARRRGCVTKA